MLALTSLIESSLLPSEMQSNSMKTRISGLVKWIRVLKAAGYVFWRLLVLRLLFLTSALDNK